MYTDNCTYCHGADGKGSRGPSITSPSVVGMTDQRLTAIIHDGMPATGMPAFAQLNDSDSMALVRFIRTLQGVDQGAPEAKFEGNPDAGRALFYGKALCSSCHMVDGKGGFIAPDLTTYALNRPPDELKQAIVSPDTHMAPGSQVANVVTKSGQKLIGVVRFEDNINLILQTEDGRYHFLTRGNLASVDLTGHSLMPRDYGSRLTPEELNDLVSFEIVSAKVSPAEPQPAKGRQRQ